MIGLPSPDGPGQPPIRLHRDHRPALAAGRQGADPGACSPPRHDAVVPLPRAYRTPAAPDQLLRPARRGRPGSSNWLDQRGITSLAERRRRTAARHTWRTGATLVDEDGAVVGEQSPGDPARRRAGHRRPGQLPGAVHRRPGRGRSAPLGRRHRLRGRRDALRAQGEQDPAVRDDVLQPMLAAALHLVDARSARTLSSWPQQIRETDQRLRSPGPHGLRHRLPRHGRSPQEAAGRPRQAAGTPLPMLAEHDVATRLAAGWDPSDPLLPVSLGVLARQAGSLQFWAPVDARTARPLIEDALASRRGREDLRPRRRRASAAPTATARMPWTAAAAPRRSRRPGRHRPHRRDHRPGRGLRNAVPAS